MRSEVEHPEREQWGNAFDSQLVDRSAISHRADVLKLRMGNAERKDPHQACRA